MSTPSLDVLHNLATQLRIDSIRATSEAGSGHPTTCMSAAEIAAVLFFAEMRFDPKDPQHPEADRFVLSKGHAAPLLYAVWSAVGAFPRADLLTLRKVTSDLEGHPTPRLPFVDVATGSLGQGLCAAIGIALNARRIGSDYRTYVLMGDGEIAEGAALKLELPPLELERYLTENIDFSLDEENLAGLRRYYEECARAGLIPRARELEFVGSTSIAR